MATSRSPGSTTGNLMTVSRSNWTAPVGYPAASTARPPRAMFSAASNPAASTFFTPSPAAEPVNVVPSTSVDHWFVPIGFAEPKVTPLIVTVGSSVIGSTVVTVMVKRPFVIALSVATVSLGPSLSTGIISFNSEGNSVLSATAPGKIVIRSGEVGMSSNVSQTVSFISSTIVAVLAVCPLMMKRDFSIKDSLMSSPHFTFTLFKTLSTVFSSVASQA